MRTRYEEKTEKEFFAMIEAKKERIVAHFYHPDFEKCSMMQNALEKIAYNHPESLFIKMDATKATFLV